MNNLLTFSFCVLLTLGISWLIDKNSIMIRLN